MSETSPKYFEGPFFFNPIPRRIRRRDILGPKKRFFRVYLQGQRARLGLTKIYCDWRLAPARNRSVKLATQKFHNRKKIFLGGIFFFRFLFFSTNKKILGVPFFKSIPMDKFELLGRLCTIEVAPKDTVLFKQGDEGTQFYMIASGKVRFTIVNPETKIETEIAVLGF